jgi:hypothetical protein
MVCIPRPKFKGRRLVIVRPIVPRRKIVASAATFPNAVAALASTDVVAVVTETYGVRSFIYCYGGAT